MIVELAASTVMILLVAGGLVGGAGLFLALARRHGAEGALPGTLALLAGLAGAAALLLAAPERDSFVPARLFAAESGWIGGGIGTALRLALPAGDAVRGAVAALWGKGSITQAGVAWLAVGGLVVTIGLVVRRTEGQARLQLALGAVALALWIALGTRFATQLLAWGLAQLGFWVLLLALLLLQAWRHRGRATGH